MKTLPRPSYIQTVQCCGQSIMVYHYFRDRAGQVLHNGDILVSQVAMEYKKTYQRQVDFREQNGYIIAFSPVRAELLSWWTYWVAETPDSRWRWLVQLCQRRKMLFVRWIKNLDIRKMPLTVSF